MSIKISDKIDIVDTCDQCDLRRLKKISEFINTYEYPYKVIDRETNKELRNIDKFVILPNGFIEIYSRRIIKKVKFKTTDVDGKEIKFIKLPKDLEV